MDGIGRAEANGQAPPKPRFLLPRGKAERRLLLGFICCAVPQLGAPPDGVVFGAIPGPAVRAELCYRLDALAGAAAGQGGVGWYTNT